MGWEGATNYFRTLLRKPRQLLELRWIRPTLFQMRSLSRNFQQLGKRLWVCVEFLELLWNFFSAQQERIFFIEKK